MSQYYYTDGKARFGPFSIEELKDKNINQETLVWKEGLVDWVPARNLSDLQSLFEKSEALPPAVPSPYSTSIPQPPPKNWLIESILITLLCCLPLGIVGIVFATKVDSLWKSGQYEEAYKASREAGKWVKLGLIFGAIGIFLYMLFLIFSVLLGLGTGIEV